MTPIKHSVKHVYQPDNTTCGYASLSMLLSHYGRDLSVEELLKVVPHPKNQKGESTGSITSQLVRYCQESGLQAHMYTSDAMVLDLSWQGWSETKILNRLKEIRDKRVTPVFSEFWTKYYIDAYIDMLQSGAKLTVVPIIRAKLISGLLQKGPVYVNICSTVNSGEGRQRDVGIRKTVTDDLKGKVSNHSVVVYGNDAKGNFLVADPWDGLVKIDPETLVCSIQAAQIECDNQCFVIEK